MRTAARLVALAGLAALAGPAHAERLAIRTLRTADGLPHSRVYDIEQDARGFLWFATLEGLGRFDGTAFRNYGKREGLDAASVHDVLLTRDGERLLATSAGIRRLDEAGRIAPLEIDGVPDTLVRALHEDPAGRVWAGTGRGLFLREGAGASARFVRVALPEGDVGAVLSFADDPDGSLWIGSDPALLRRLPDGRIVRYATRGFDGSTRFRSLLVDDAARLWIGHETGLVVLARRAASDVAHLPDAAFAIARRSVELGALDGESRALDLPAEPGDAVGFTAGNDLTVRAVRRIARTRDGHIWIAQVGRGLLRVAGGRLQRFDGRHGLPDETLNDVVEDRAGGLWLAGDAIGAMRVDWDGLVGYGAAEGLEHTYVEALFEDPEGRVIAVAADFRVSALDGDRFDTVTRPLPPGRSDPYFWEEGLLTREGAWWLPTPIGIHRFAPSRDARTIGTARPVAVYGAAEGVPGPAVGPRLEDRAGNLWWTVARRDAPLVRWERARDRFRAFGAADGLPDAPVGALAEAPDGAVWVGFGDGSVARFDGERFARAAAGGGLPGAPVRDLLFDAAGRLWIATDGGGLGRVDRAVIDPADVDRAVLGPAVLDPAVLDPAGDGEPGAGRLDGRVYGAENGFASESVRCLVDDRWGRVYAGTGRGIQVLAPAETGDGATIGRLGLDDGLIHEEVQAALRDRHGDLWFGTLDGLSRLRPVAPGVVPPPRVYVGRVLVDGTARPVADDGVEAVAALELGPGGRHLQIDYFALPFAAGRDPRYAYRLDGADDPERWTAAGTARSVTFANLAPGRYAFRVRAVDATGRAVSAPATVAFRVLPPFWRTAWFAALVAAALAAAAWAVHRTRLARALEVERLRTRIATDLHDDIGSNLSQVAILGEVTLRELGSGPAAARAPLRRIADVSRETIDTMSDIVWAIDPERDRVGDLVRRMRRFANDLSAAGEFAVDLDLPDAGLDARLGADVKRQLYLVFKESLHNAARHARCREVRVRLGREGRGWRLEVRDDGAGFDPGAASAGHGLGSMRARAGALGGRLAIRSTPGAGTAVVLELPDHVGRRGGR